MLENNETISDNNSDIIKPDTCIFEFLFLPRLLYLRIL